MKILLFILGWLSIVLLGNPALAAQIQILKVSDSNFTNSTEPNLIATAQFPDLLIYKGENHRLFSNPLESFYNEKNPRPNFDATNTANWRGYLATWEIEGGILYLRAIEAKINGKSIGLKDLFPDRRDRRDGVEATWFTGKLRIPQGELIEYIHMGYESVYERDLILTIKNGRLIREEIIDNTSKS